MRQGHNYELGIQINFNTEQYSLYSLYHTVGNTQAEFTSQTKI